MAYTLFLRLEYLKLLSNFSTTKLFGLLAHAIARPDTTQTCYQPGYVSLDEYLTFLSQIIFQKLPKVKIII